MKLNIIFRGILFLLLFVLALLPGTLSAQDENPKILYLNSYHQGFGWSDNIVKGLLTTLEPEQRNIELYIEYMDTKRLFDEEHLTRLYQIYRYKYRDVTFDAIIVSDNNAFDFVRKHYTDLFEGTPVVFCGVNNFDPSMLEGFDNFTGVPEKVDIHGSLDLIFDLHPNIEQIVVVNDTTTTGEVNQQVFESIRAEYENRIDFIIWQDFAMPDLLDALADLPQKTAIFLISLARDNTGEFFNYEESAERISAATDHPIYGVFDVYVGNGVVGGLVTSGFAQGEVAAKMVLQILKGEAEAGDIPIPSSPNRYLFDFEKLQAFGIRPDQLPKDSIIIDEELPFWVEYRSVIIVGVFIFMGMVVIIIVLIFFIVKRTQAENALRAQQNRLRELVQQSSLLASVVESSDNAILAAALDGTILSWNTGAANLYGYEEAEIIGRPVSILESDEAKGELEAQIAQIQEGESVLRHETVHQTKDSTRIDVLLAISPVRDSGGTTTGASIVIQNITERVQAQLERERLQEEIILAQKQAIRELSSPIVPVLEDVLVMPLTGTIDTTRAQEILSALLEGITDLGASVVILDVTGVPVVDTSVANTIIQAATATQLLGSDFVLVGIKPEVAQTIISLGVNLSHIVTRGNLQDGIEYALRKQGRRISEVL